MTGRINPTNINKNMNISSRLIAPIAIQDRNNRVVSVDLAAFVTRLLLFDTYILQSIWLEDLILLQHSLGTAGLSQLFESGALKFHCAAFTIGQTGQARAVFSSDHPRSALPPFNYQFSVLRVQDEEEKVDRALAAFDPSLRAELIKGRVQAPPPAEYSKRVFEPFYRDLTSDLLNSAVQMELRRRGIIPIAHHLDVKPLGDDEFAVKNDLGRRYLLPDVVAHRIIESAMMALGGLDERLASMYTYSALTGLNEKDSALLGQKLGMVANLVAPKSAEKEFSRIISLKGLPVPVYGSTILDVKALLRIRESDECRAFKQWLSGVQSFSDKELRERLSGFGRRIRQALHTKTGKALRFAVSNGLGIGLGIASPFVGIPAGIVVSAIDSFLIDRLAPKDAVLSFLSESYPSLFEAKAER